ncbi:hypothetical protein BDM02DRAFT_3120106 [Thelephora ganbajun]|uniref:Uncharacterized protein n=1 Tax=Thelephora ganbajun TaxID=370292 RepID=A0ACB6Z778_THEGA|nr:hypothetical protein BDM02DRAFT_3120106 [Thelephora ganbajun]
MCLERPLSSVTTNLHRKWSMNGKGKTGIKGLRVEHRRGDLVRCGTITWWRTTGEYRWRDYAWRIFESIEKYTKAESGYASVKVEGDGNVVKENEMPRSVRLVPSDESIAEEDPRSSFFLAET